MSVSDRWHKSYPRPGELLCREHGKAPKAEHGLGDQWQVRWRDATGAPRKRNFAKHRVAVSFDAEIRTQLDRGTSLDISAGKRTVQEYAESYRRTLAIRPATAERLDRVFRLHVGSVPLGQMPIASVRPSHVRAWAKDRSTVLAASTLAVVWANVAAMFNAAVLDRVIGVSPFAGLKPPSPDTRPRFVPATEQVLAVVDALPPRYRAAAALAAGCGWRRNEILGVEVGAINFLGRTAEVRQQLLALSGQPIRLAPPKTPTSYRTNELPSFAALWLAQHLEKFASAERAILDCTDPRKPVERSASLVFTTATGSPVHPAWWADVWRTAADKAGFPPRTGVHCLRHYHASLLIHEGKSVKAVQVAMGHATPMITLNTYAGMWPEEAGSTRSIIDAALGNMPSECPDTEAKS